MMKQLTTNNLQPTIKQRGIALYIAITVTGALVLVSYAIIEIALKQISISSIGRDSQQAFYAADTGAECAIYWDIKNPTSPGRSAFATSTAQNITCNYDPATPAVNPTNANMPVGNTATSTFRMYFSPDPYCADVVVGKSYSGNTLKTTIESRGYNTCDTTAPQRVERAVRISY